MNIVLIQDQFNVGAISANAAKIRRLIEQYSAHDLIVFPELALSGYPPEDLIWQHEFREAIEAATRELQSLKCSATVLIGCPRYEGDLIYNSCLILEQGKARFYDKQYLPNDGVFDEPRYFTTGTEPCVVAIKEHRAGLLICEDLWHAAAYESLAKTRLDLLVVINASPYERNKFAGRFQHAQQAAQTLQAPLIYLNAVGTQDEIIFDGDSFVVNAEGELVLRMKEFAPQHPKLQLAAFHTLPTLEPMADQPADIYHALIFATREYVTRSGFKGALIGLSGGIDSALTLAIAVDALGAENVEAVMMPSRFSAAMSLEDAILEAEALKVKYHQISIEPVYKSFLETLQPHVPDQTFGLMEENLQARCRGNILMALSNKTGKMVLTTGNKSEIAVGYCTLYGDMAGGFAVLKDVYKTEVYELARYRNSLANVIPERVLTRAPSAELRADQKDEDSLPPYEWLDQILKLRLEDNLSASEIVMTLLNPSSCDREASHRIQKDDLTAMVDKTLHLLKQSEYKRRQAPLGPKISRRAFGRDWRVPVVK